MVEKKAAVNAGTSDNIKLWIKSLISLFLFFSIGATSIADENSLSTNLTLLNAIHSDEIKTIMQRLRVLIHEREYTELELQKLNNKQIELLAKEATELSKAAANLPNIESLKNLDEEEQTVFNAMVNQLNEITRKLIVETEGGHNEEVDLTYKKLQETCNTCHQIFRDNY